MCEIKNATILTTIIQDTHKIGFQIKSVWPMCSIQDNTC